MFRSCQGVSYIDLAKRSLIESVNRDLIYLFRDLLFGTPERSSLVDTSYREQLTKAACDADCILRSSERPLEISCAVSRT